MENNKLDGVKITDIQMPFWSMVIFMVKAAIASIPAIFILAIIFTIISAVFGGLFGGLARL